MKSLFVTLAFSKPPARFYPVLWSSKGILSMLKVRLIKLSNMACLAYRPAFLSQNRAWWSSTCPPRFRSEVSLSFWTTCRVKVFSHAPDSLPLSAKILASSESVLWASSQGCCCFEHNSMSYLCWNFQSVSGKTFEWEIFGSTVCKDVYNFELMVQKPANSSIKTKTNNQLDMVWVGIFWLT